MPSEPISPTLAEIDDELSMLRESWMTSIGEKKAKWAAMIDKALDRRLALMKPASNPPLPLLTDH